MQRPHDGLDAEIRKLLWGIAALLVAAAPAMTGCKGFFIPVCQANNNCPTSSTTPPASVHSGPLHAGRVSVSGSVQQPSVIYVADPARQRVQGFSMSNDRLVPMQPFYTAGQTTIAVALSEKDHLLFRATREGIIYIDRIESDGALAPDNRQQVAAFVPHPAALVIDSTRNLLFVASSNPASLRVFEIDAKTGTLQLSAQGAISLGASNPVQLALTPNHRYVFAALGGDGVDGFQIHANGTLSSRIHVSPMHPGVSQDNALAFDSGGKYLFVGEAGVGIRVLSLGSDGALAGISGSSVTGPSTGPSALAVSSDGILYASYPALKEIAAYKIGSGGDIALFRTVPFSSAASPSALSIGIDGANLFTLMQDGNLHALRTAEFASSH